MICLIFIAFFNITHQLYPQSDYNDQLNQQDVELIILYNLNATTKNQAKTEQRKSLKKKSLSQEYQNNNPANFSLQCSPALGIPIIIGSVGTPAATPFVPIIMTTIAIGLIIKEGISFIKGKKNKSNNSKSNTNDDCNERFNNSGPNNEKDPQNKKKNSPFITPTNNKKHPERTYEPNPKHHQNSKNGIGKSPKNPEKSLDSSIEVPGKQYRLSVENGELVKFQEHSPGKYHGYIVNTSEKIIHVDRNALQESGLAKQLKKGHPYR